MVIQSKFRAGEVLIPVLLIGIDVVAQVCPDVAVCILRLSICLRVVGSTEVEVCSQGLE